MSKIYWEAQTEGRFCALHCVNSLLQAPVFTKRDLEKFGWDLDRREKELLAGNNKRYMDTSDLSASENVAGDGFFSVGVLQLCLTSRGFTVAAWTTESSNELLAEKGFICHHNDHWFTIRNIANEWWNLDSLASSPQKITSKALVRKLSDLKNFGYSVLIVRGNYASIPPPTFSGLESHQHYATENDLKGRAAESSTSSSGGFHEIRKQENYSLYQGEGKSLQDAAHTSLSQQEADSDPELTRALEISRLEAAQQGIKEPPPEVAAGVNTVLINIRMGAYGTIKRRFDNHDSIHLMFQWIEYEAAKHPISPPLNVRSNYYVAQMPIRRIEKTFEGCVVEHGTGDRREITGKPLNEVMEANEGFNLEL